MKTTSLFVKMAARSVVGFALLAVLGLGVALPTPTHQGPQNAGLRASAPVRVVDGTESNGGKGSGNPKKRQIGHIA